MHAWSDSNLYLLRRKCRLELHAEHRAHPAPEPFAVSLQSRPLHLRVEEDDERVPPEQGDDLAGRVLRALEQRPMNRGELRNELRVRNDPRTRGASDSSINHTVGR